MKSKFLVCFTSFVLACAMVGCSQHENILSKIDPETASAFLYNTAIAAKIHLNFNGPNDGSLYAACMNGHISDVAQCKSLYQEMLKLAHDNPNYKDLTLDDITDHQLWSNLSDDYKRHQFDTVI